MKVLIDLEYYDYLKKIEERTANLYQIMWENFMFDFLKESTNLKINKEIKLIENEEETKNIM